jgi:cell surface protein SprA
MVGVRNPNKNNSNPWKPDDGTAKCFEVWINELRLTDFDQHGGWAAIGRVNANLADFAQVAVSGNYSTPYWGSIEKKVSERQRDTRYGWDGSTSFELGKFFPEKWGIKVPLFLGYSENIIRPQFDPLTPDIEFNDLPSDQQAISKAKVIDYTRRRSMNFTNVHKERGQGKKAHFYDVENLSLSYSYSELYKRDINTEFNITKTYRGGLNYQFTATPRPFEPFKNSKFLAKSKWFTLIKDINLFYQPKSITFRNDLNRSYNAMQVRNNYEGLVFPTYTKNFTWVRAYDVKYDLSKNIKFDLNANNNAVIGEPLGRVDKLYQDEYQTFKDSVWQSLQQFGINKQYNHTANVNITWPTAKIPALDWINLTTRYSVSYDWQRAPFGQDTLGNTVQNSRNVNWSAQLNMNTLYNKVPYLKKINQKAQGGGNQKGVRGQKDKEPQPKPGEEKTASYSTKKKEKEPIFTVWENIARVGMSLKNVSVTYSTTDGIMLPGFKATNAVLGMDNSWDSPGFGFVFGKQNRDLWGREADWGNGENDYARYAADNNWLIQNKYLNTQYTSNHTQNINARASLEPLTGLRIDINGERNISENYTTFFRYVDTANGQIIDDYLAQNEMFTGMMSMSVLTWKTAFSRNSSDHVSQVFEDFRDNRAIMSDNLAGQNANSSGANTSEPGYRDGYGGTQQDVLIGSFIATYTGKTPGEKHINPFKMMPMPNWRITFDPMAKTKIKFLKKYFKSLSITHGYRSTMTIANYTTNMLATKDANGDFNARDIGNNIINSRQISVITISEQFSPLINIDITWNMKNKSKPGNLITKFEIKRDRNLSLSLTNNQLTEIISKEFIVGSGYRFNNVKLPFQILGKDLESNLNVKFDLSIRNNMTITRKIVENLNQATAGQNMVSIKSSADYQLTDKLMLRVYYDKVINKPVVSTSFPTANTNAGLAIRFTL